MNVLYQFNEKYAPYAGVSITSLFENNKAVDSIDVYILGEELSKTSTDKFLQLAIQYNRKVIFVETDSLIARMKELNMPTYRGSYAANMRLFVSDIVTNGDRLLYLDADTIVVGELSDMYNSDIETVGMVYDSLGCKHKYDIGLSELDGYYNSGVILYDLNKWRAGKFTEKIVEHVANVRSQYPSPDQDLINIVLKGNITSLPFECNYQPHLRVYSYDLFMKVFEPVPFYTFLEVSQASCTPLIMHAFRYLGEFPWHKASKHPFCDEFDQYLKMSLWNDYVKEPSDSGIVMAIERLLYVVMPKGLFLRLFQIMHRRFFIKAEKLSRKNQISQAM